MSRFKAIEDVWAFLDGIPMFQKSGIKAANFSLDNIKAFCEALGNPQDKYPGIHVAGTNGKGTTCYLLEKVYKDAGYKTGLFTSPHLLRYNERIRVNGQEITDEELLEFFQTTDKLLDQVKLSYFEISTALAFWFFSRQNIDIAIIETGLGGRLDSTNIITPEVSVITSIGLDHQNVLGNSLSEIAREKAGIIKQGKPVVLGFINHKPRKVIEEVANQSGSKVYRAKELHPVWEFGKVTLNNGEIQVQTNFREQVNKWNIACIWQVINILQTQFPVEKNHAIKSLESFTGAPARFEKIHPVYEWYFSGSHNQQALQSSLQAVQAMKPISDVILVFSAMKDKLNAEILHNFKGFKRIFFVEQEGERAAKFKDIKDEINAELMEESQNEIILNELKTELVIFMGSFYFYPIVKRWTANVS